MLLHVDLYQLLRGIDLSCWTSSLRRLGLRRERLGRTRFFKDKASVKRGKRSFASLQKPFENDQIVRSYFNKPFFKRLRGIVVNTVQCEYSANQLQLAMRKANNHKHSRILKLNNKLFLAPDAIARPIHAELYASWSRNLSILDPASVFTTQVSSSGDLLLNGSVIVEGWSNRFYGSRMP